MSVYYFYSLHLLALVIDLNESPARLRNTKERAVGVIVLPVGSSGAADSHIVVGA